MTNTSTESIPTLIPGSATKPIFGAGLTDENMPNISWEVSDGTFPEDPIEDTAPSPEQHKENVPEQEEKEEKEEEDVELSDTEESDDKSEEPKKKYKNRTPPAKRIADITREKKQYESLAQTLLRDKEDLTRQLAQERKEKAETKFDLIKNSRDRLQYDLNQAIENGDSAEQARLTSLLSEYQAELRILQRENVNHTVPPKNETPLPQENYKMPDNHPYSGVGDEWAKKNSWADPDSKNFNKRLYDAADEYSISLADQYSLEGKGEEIGSPEFFDEITDYIKESYSLSRPVQKPKPKEPIQMTNPGSNVSSVNRPSPNAETTKAKNEISLTNEQKQVAHSMRGVYKDKNGNRIYDNRQLEEAYKQHLRSGM